MSTKRIAVTGASGFIGRALVARLNADGCSVDTLSRADLAAETQLAQRIANIDCVVHLAARAHRGGTPADFEGDIALAKQLATLAAEQGARRFVHMSSIGVLGTCSSGAALTEAATPAPREHYAQAKLRAEDAVQAQLKGSATQWVIVRPPMVYGANAPGNFSRLVRAVARGIPLPFASVRNRRSFVGIDNLVDALAACISNTHAAGEIFHVADAEALATPDLIRLIAQGLDIRPRLWPCPPSLLHAAAAITGKRRIAESLLHDMEIDCTKIERILGWRAPIPAQRGIVAAAAKSAWART